MENYIIKHLNTPLGIYSNQNIYLVKNQTKTMFVNQNDSNLEFPIFKSY